MPTDHPVLVGFHDHRLVVLSVFISVVAAYASRQLSDRIRDASGWIWLTWLAGGAVVDGIGTWSMHFTGMTAFKLPIPVLYDSRAVMISLLVGILGSAATLSALSHREIGWARALAASIFLGGVGISGLHYTAMEAMRTQAIHHHSPPLAILSVVLAIVLSFMSIGLGFFFRDEAPGHSVRKQASALLRGAANPSMHYTAMAALSFTPTSVVPDLSHAVSISAIGILGISIVPVMVLIVAMLTSVVDRLQKQRALLDELFEQAPQAVVLMSSYERVVRVNREFTRLFGYAPDEVLNRHLRELIIIDEARNKGQGDRPLEANRHRVEEEGVRRRKDDSRLHVSIVRVPVSMPGGQVEIYAIYRDITAQKQAEAALREYADQLQALSRQLLEVQETERGHLARELHDEIGQTLTGLRLLLKPSNDQQAGADNARFERARSIVDELVQRVRGLSFDLRPAALDQLGLLPALLALFERYTDQTGVLVNFKHDRLDDRFPVEVETSAYRLVQEALTNVARHAGVSTVTLRVWATPEALNLQVEDRGRGFDPEVALAAPGSSGLAGMKERVRLLEGIFTIESSPGGGTQLTAEFPLRGGSGRQRDDHIHHLG